MPTYTSVGIVGAGKRGLHRAKWLRNLPNVQFKGIFDTDAQLCQQTATSLETVRFRSLPDLLQHIQVLVVANGTAEHFEVAETALQQGIHVFLDGKPTSSIHESISLLKTAEEADAEVGVSAPLRFHPALSHLPDIPKLLTLEADVASDSGRTWQYELSHFLHLCLAITQSEAIQRIEASAVHNPQHQLQALALGLRFQNGVYTQIRLRQMANSFQKLYAVAPHFQVEADLRRYEVQTATSAASEFTKTSLPKMPLHLAEMQAFITAIREGNTAPVSLLHAMSVQRLTERILQRLR